MLHIIGKLFGGLFAEDNVSDQAVVGPEFKNDKAKFWRAIKLVHCDDLHEWDLIRKYNENNCLSYEQYERGVADLQELKRANKELLAAQRQLSEWDSGELKEYDSFTVEVPASLFRKTRSIPLKQPEHPNTSISVSRGQIEDSHLQVRAGWSNYKVDVTYSCPLRDYHAQDIASIRNKLAQLDESSSKILKEINESRFNHPVLFVSHRWESVDHPDPSGAQLKKLRQLKNCFIIYDYASFPQQPMNGEQKEMLRMILTYMSVLIKNVVILHSPEYIDRGWCLYEYISASLRGTVICDEIQDPQFISLRNWAATRVAFPQNPFRDSYESMQQNYVNEQVLTSVNSLLPLYKNALFTVPADRGIVRDLLLRLLMHLLPGKKTHQPYLGEWKETPWSAAELDEAFESELKWEKQQTMHKQPFDTKVPRTIEEAVQRHYKIEKDTMYKQWFM